MKRKTLDFIESALDACFIEPRGDPNRSNCITAAYLVKALMNQGVEVSKEWIKYLKKGNPGKHDFLKEIEDLEEYIE